MDNYGKELILDLHDCDPSTFNRKSIREYFNRLCDLIDMEKEKLCWWDYQGVPIEEQDTEAHLVGTTAVQFIKTSNIVIHTLDLLGNVYINVFSCKDFDENAVKDFSEKWFNGKTVNSQVVNRI